MRYSKKGWLGLLQHTTSPFSLATSANSMPMNVEFGWPGTRIRTQHRCPLGAAPL